MRTSSREPIARQCVCCDSSRLEGSPAVLMPFVASRAFGHEPVEITAEWGLRDLRPGMAYSLCRSLHCLDCGLLFLDWRFTDAQLAALYHDYRGTEYTRQRDRFEPGYAAGAARDFHVRHAYIAEVEAWLAPWLPEQPVVLDFGGGDGMNSPFLGRSPLLHVHDVSGVAVVEGATTVRADAIALARYDLVVCSQVLEHVPFPLDLLENMLPALGPGSLLYLEVPRESLMRNSGSGLARLKHHWHEHINFFSESSLHRLCERAGLRVLAQHQIAVNLGARQGEIMGLLARRT
jgi:SAM-dependent methyltransferase